MYQVRTNQYFRMASAVPVLSKEETNFLRVVNLLIRLSPKAVRILFDREFNPGGLKSIFSKNWKKKHVITQTQWCLLFPSGEYIVFVVPSFIIPLHMLHELHICYQHTLVLNVHISTRVIHLTNK